ncbi:MAG: DUF924 family protein [Hyphomicrobiaceae bacterium]
MSDTGDRAGEPAWVGEVIRFWLEETAPKARFGKDAGLDAVIADRFGALYEKLAAVPPAPQALTPRLALAALIVLDQFSRNMFRDSPRAFAADATARAIAEAAVAARLDLALEREARLFVYLPFEHAEDMEAQDRAVSLIAALGDDEWTRYAIAHRDIIARFGRFPHRNAVLGRHSTPEEIEFLKRPGSSF